MKRLALILAAVMATALGPVALDIAHAQNRGGGHGSGREMRQGGGWERQGRGGGGWERQGRGPDRGWSQREVRGPDRGPRYGAEQRGPRADRGGSGYRGERRDPERGPRYVDERRRPQTEPRERYGDERRNRGRRDDPPYGSDAPRFYYPRAPGVRPGGYLPPSYRGAPIQDYRRYRLRPPPHGYSWVRVGDGFALVSPDGQIFDMVR